MHLNPEMQVHAAKEVWAWIALGPSLVLGQVKKAVNDNSALYCSEVQVKAMQYS